MSRWIWGRCSRRVSLHDRRRETIARRHDFHDRRDDFLSRRRDFLSVDNNLIPISANRNADAFPGQAYVALSRATSLDGLQVLNFDENKVRVHPKVVEWVKTLETIKC